MGDSTVRRVLRGVFTREANQLRDLLNSSADLEQHELKARMLALSSRYDKIKMVDNAILLAMESDPQVNDCELESQYEGKHYTLMCNKIKDTGDKRDNIEVKSMLSNDAGLSITYLQTLVAKSKGIILSDALNNSLDTQEIQLLLGADSWALLMTNDGVRLNENLMATQTKLGWLVSSKWWEEPSWLYLPETECPNSKCVEETTEMTDINLTEEEVQPVGRESDEEDPIPDESESVFTRTGRLVKPREILDL
ncbi:hypothetical protein GE061_006023 [Apolygus lucorum]|uniref:Uncharacterized protein n=1 Tax=Apolygus lucorum TaxID=248454 RepID=A0A8S9WWM1_APOLU|nr:hypothetical protein GE061_006023 [Apolygus lucorum]